MYNEEKLEAKNFLAIYKFHPVVEQVLKEASNPSLIHSDRWSIIYDMIDEAFPEYKNSKVVTGLTYLVEEGNI